MYSQSMAPLRPVVAAVMMMMVGVVVVVAVPEQTAVAAVSQSGDDSCPVDFSSFRVEGPKETALDAKVPVPFTVRMKWAPGLRMKVKVMQGENVHSEELYAPGDAGCGKILKNTFQVYNHGDKRGDGPDVLSHAPGLTVYVSIGTGDGESNKHCLNRMCKKFPLTYEFLPSPGKIQLSHSPKDIRVGKPGTVECSTLDGNPQAEPVAIKVVDRNTAEPILVANLTKLSMQASLAGRYQCMVLSRAFGKTSVIVSDQWLDVLLPFPVPGLDKVIKYKSKRAADHANMMDRDGKMMGKDGMMMTTMQTAENIRRRRPRGRGGNSGENRNPSGVVLTSALAVCALPFFLNLY